MVTEQCQPPELSGMVTCHGSGLPGGYQPGLRLAVEEGGWMDEWGFLADLCPLQMKSFMLVSTSTSWARTQPSSAPWASRQP